jgi:hypothetical protein
MENNSSHDQSRRRFLKTMAVATGTAALPGMALKEAFGAATKTPKSTVQYRDHPNGKQECAKCMYFIAPKSKGGKAHCKVVQGVIKPQGWCMLFTAKSK